MKLTPCQRTFIGPSFYQDAVLPFYLALKVYPAPLELIMIYQKTIPEPIFQILVTIMAKEQNNRVNAFYEQFPGADTGLVLGEIPVGTNPEGKTIIRRGLVAQKEFAEGDVLFTEAPLVSALFPALEVSIQRERAVIVADQTNQTTGVFHCIGRLLSPLSEAGGRTRHKDDLWRLWLCGVL